MNFNMLKEHGIDVEEGIKRFGGREDKYEKYLLAFTEEESFEQLKKAMEENKYEEAFKCSHALKGIAGNLSLKDFYNCLFDFVECLRNGKDIEKAQSMFSQLERLYIECSNAIIGSK